MKFTKMHGLGNDFICIKYDENIRYNLNIFSKFLCDRHYGIGADGLILLYKSNIADIKMRIFNNDGTEAEMCGNGIRCIAKFAYNNGLVEKDCISIETKAGIKKVYYILENKKIMAIKVDMGTPILDTKKIPLYIPCGENRMENKINKVLFKIKDKEYIGSCLSMGNPHTVIQINDLRDFDVEKIGTIVENYKYFPSKTNVEFVQIINQDNIRIKVWERGVGETLACGTGACAAAYTCFENRKTKNSIKVDLEGGSLKIDIDEETKNIYMTGDAVTVYEGVIDF